jgi:A/G-specific adenine glycosylase
MLSQDLKGAIKEKRERLNHSILDWSLTHLRAYPWREPERTPYEVLVAEVLLKRTTATAAARVYDSFIHQFPTNESITAATEEQLVSALSNVGLQRQRAKSLKALVRYLTEEQGGNIPSDLDHLLRIPGLGEYSARAVLSFGYGIPVAVVDANVERILGRIFQNVLPQRPPGRLFQELASSLLPSESHKKHNLGLLDLGALICRYIDPPCQECPLTSICDYYNENKARLIKEKPGRYETVVGTKLRNMRKEKRIGLAKLAQLAKVSKLTIIRIESGKTSPRPETIAKLAAALGAPVEELTAKRGV